MVPITARPIDVLVPLLFLPTHHLLHVRYGEGFHDVPSNGILPHYHTSYW